MIKKKTDSLKAPQNMLMLGLFLAFLMSHVAHTYFEGLMLTWTEFSKVVILYFLFVLIIDTEKKFKITIFLIVFLTFLLAIQGIQQFNTGYGWAGQTLTTQSYGEIDSVTGKHLNMISRINWISIFGDPNDLGLTLVIAISILMAFLFGKVKFITRIILIPILGYILYALYLTNSRGAFVSLMTAVFFYFVRRSKRFLLGGIIGVLFVFLIFSFGPSRLALMSTDEESAYNRADAWYYGIQLTKHNPIFGVGYRMFEEDFPMTAHNSFVLAMAEAGLLGLFFWVGLFYSSLKGLLLVQKNNERLKNYSYGLQATLAGFAGAAFFLSRLYIILPYMLFALSASLVNVGAGTVKNTFDLKDIRNIGLACIGIIGLVYVIIKIAL
ncbi:MAG: O-antigen ligase family protein [Candidatus Omnitrophica bacterium]|nr:O-antigen ligase family protein [Candidatus Omnitrophota bacterium]